MAICSIALLVALRAPGAGTLTFPETKLTANDGVAYDAFGYDVALDGDTAIVGAPGVLAYQGAVYVFTRSGTTWSFQQKLTAVDPPPGIFEVGWSVALSGDTALVGTYGGGAYVFVRNGTTWTQQQKLSASDGVFNDHFGISVALEGNTAIVGTLNSATSGRGAYVFERSGTVWTEKKKLTTSVANQYFGKGVALRNGTALVAGPDFVTVFVGSGSTWTEQGTLTNPEPSTDQLFGSDLALDGDTAIVSDHRNDDTKSAAHVFVRNGVTWSYQQKLTPSAVSGSSGFGRAVAIERDEAWVGASSPGANKSYVFRRSGTSWTEAGTVASSDASSDFGRGVALAAGHAIVGAPVSDTNKGKAYIYEVTSRRPVFLVPGIAGTYAANLDDDGPWTFERGIAPSAIRIDPLAGAYDDIIQTLKNVGYVDGKDLFVVNYDWRLPPGPFDGTFDGVVNGLTASGISDNTFEYAVDYLGEALKRAVTKWETDHPGKTLDSVDVISHSTGGLVTRSYIQSTAYNGLYDGSHKLPKVENFVLMGVPNRGASKAWNPIHDNWVADPAYVVVLSKIIVRAWQKVIHGGVILGPPAPIDLASITVGGQPSPALFIEKYVPTIRSLLATYNFLDLGSGLTNVNADVNSRNSLVLDLNDGLDFQATADPSPFASLCKATVIYGTNVSTKTTTKGRIGPSGSGVIARFVDYRPHDAGAGEIWCEDVDAPINGDGTVPLDSAKEQFVGDSRVTLRPFTKGQNTQGEVSHLALMYNTDTQKEVLKVLGASYKDADISTSKHFSAATSLLEARNVLRGSALSLILDPVEGYVTDGQGRRLGFTQATGKLTEIPGSVWFGNAEGMGWAFSTEEDPLVEPLALHLDGLGSSYWTMASVYGAVAPGGVVDEGTLGQGATRTVPMAVGARGDANADGSVTVADVLYLINALFAGGSAPSLTRGDANSSGGVDVGDVLYLINFLFAGGPPPAA